MGELFAHIAGMDLAVSVPLVTTLIVGAASTVAPFIPQAAAAMPVLKTVKKGVDLLACNFGSARNAPDKPHITELKENVNALFDGRPLNEKLIAAQELYYDAHTVKNEAPELFAQIGDLFCSLQELVRLEDTEEEGK